MGNYLADVFNGAHIAVTDTNSGIDVQIVDVHTRIHNAAAMRTMTNHANDHLRLTPLNEFLNQIKCATVQVVFGSRVSRTWCNLDWPR